MTIDSKNELLKKEFSRAKEYASEYHGDHPKAHLFNTRIQRVSELLGEFNNGKVLDIGCGPGIIGNTFRGKPIEYYGVDISEEMIKVCNDTFGHDQQFRFSLGRVESLSFPDSCFDVVLCLGMFEYVQDVHLAMNDIGRVLKPNGVFIVTMLNSVSPYRIWERYIYWKIINFRSKINRLKIKEKDRESTKGSKMILYTETVFRDLLTNVGLAIEDVVYYDFNLFIPPMDSFFPKASVFISKKLEYMCRSKLKFLGTGFIIKCRKK